MKIGILGFQGAIIEHERHVAAIGAEPVIVRYREQLPELDGIILPGGESTTMGKLLNRTGMMEPLRDAIAGGLPAWGTCAGMILLAKRLENDPARYLALMDITVRRNAYGRQIDSFSTSVEIPDGRRGAGALPFGRARRGCPRGQPAGYLLPPGADGQRRFPPLFCGDVRGAVSAGESGAAAK